MAKAAQSDEFTAAFEQHHLAVTVGSLLAVAARLVHHSEAIPAVVHVGEVAEQVACAEAAVLALLRESLQGGGGFAKAAGTRSLIFPR
jgi:hypothetical protein